jgi:malate dehydrogenase (oxaloacetate-decarboxylating)
MLRINETCDYIETDITGKYLMTVAQLNKGTAFTREERKAFQLDGKLPARIETLEEQVERAYYQFSYYDSDLQKHIYLNNLHDKNQVLFYKLVSENLKEMVPLIYTPSIATAVQEYSREYRQPRGLFISYEDKDRIDEILDNRTNPYIDLIVVTDGEGVLGIGDQGVGSINIPIAKLMMYTLFSGISPLRTLPIYLDVGTNNNNLLKEKFYLGHRTNRISQDQYDEFINCFVKAIQRKFPKAFLHWEDFGRGNARKILEEYQHQLCTFNDDIQGTGAVALSAILSGIKKSGIPIKEQKIIIFGAGSAGIGIADQIYRSLIKYGLSDKEAKEKLWLIDKNGLVTELSENLTLGQKRYARKDITQNLNLLNCIQLIHPNILIGSSAQGGAFTEEIIKTMAHFVEKPIVFPLSNPTHQAEQTPENIIRWTEGRALIATGSPFEPVIYKGKTYVIPQCNNALIFPGIGLGLLTCQSSLLTDDMLFIAANVLSDHSENALLPQLTDSIHAAIAIAKAIIQEAVDKKLNRVDLPHHEPIESILMKNFWHPRYLPFKYKKISEN